MTRPDAAAPWLAPGEATELRETHSAVVILAGDLAYKFKKPVDLGFLDFRTEAARRRACRREVELNRRLAPDVYLDVIRIEGSAGRSLDHGVLMRRMPSRLRLSTLVTEGVDVRADLRALAGQVAAFHATARRGSRISAAGRAAALRRRWTNNLNESQRFCGSVLPALLHARIADLALAYVDGRADLLAERAAAGLVVDGHGDLTAEDVFCLPDHPRALDCIEFDDRLRYVDVLDDVAFLAMDLEHLGRPDLGKLFLRAYLAASEAPTVRTLEHHYIAYRAFVRAKVSCIQHDQGRPGAAEQGRRYAELAAEHLQAGQMRLIAVAGPPGTGKTTVAARLAGRLGYRLLSTDDIRRELHIPAAARYTEAAKTATYEALLERASNLLRRGECVVADATWGTAASRAAVDQVATRTRSRFQPLECRLPSAVAAGRAQARLESGASTSEAGAEVAGELARQWIGWAPATVIDTSGPIDDALAAAVTAVRDHGG